MAIHSSILAWRIPWTEECGIKKSPVAWKNYSIPHYFLNLVLNSFPASMQYRKLAKNTKSRFVNGTLKSIQN